MTTRNILWLSFILCLMNLAIGLFLGYKLFSEKEKPDKPLINYWDSNYKTLFDSLKVEFSKVKIDTSGFKDIKPQIQIVYQKEKPKKPQEVFCNSDSLQIILDSLKGEIVKVPITFLTSFQNNPKILHGYFSKDTISLTLFPLDGNTTTKIYQADFNNYRYQWVNNELKATQIKPISESKKAYSTLYVNSGIISYTRSPFLDLSYQFYWKKIKLETSAKYLITPNLPLIAIGVGYQIK